MRHIRLRGLQRLAPLPSLVDWCEGVSVSRLLELAITLCGHMEGSSALLAAVLQVEALVVEVLVVDQEAFVVFDAQDASMLAAMLFAP